MRGLNSATSDIFGVGWQVCTTQKGRREGWKDDVFERQTKSDTEGRKEEDRPRESDFVCGQNEKKERERERKGICMFVCVVRCVVCV